MALEMMEELMKRLMLLAGLFLLASPLLALDPPTISTNTPASVAALADGLHILDNITPATFWDWSNGEWLGGGTTTLYKKYYVSADAGVVTSLKDNTKNALYMGGLRFHAGELLVAKSKTARDIVNQDVILQGLLKYMTAGIWGARDWDAAKWRSGIYTGFEFSF
jgi:hypothetical protein